MLISELKLKLGLLKYKLKIELLSIHPLHSPTYPIPLGHVTSVPTFPVKEVQEIYL